MTESSSVSGTHGSQAKSPAATTFVALCCLALAVNALGAQNPPSAIRGTLSDAGMPITQATVFLQSFDNEACAKLFTTAKADRQSASKLESCMHDVGSTSPDAAGTYKFAAPAAGWYAVYFLWNIAKKPSPPSTYSFNQGRWSVIYAGHKDSTGR